jgi:hypothetical protein
MLFVDSFLHKETANEIDRVPKHEGHVIMHWPATPPCWELSEISNRPSNDPHMLLKGCSGSPALRNSRLHRAHKAR